MPVKFKRNSLLPLLMMVIGGVLILGSLAWFGYADQSPTPEASATATQASVEIVPYAQIKRVSLADAKAAYDLGSAVFLDVRGEPYYSQGHIAGALSVTEDEFTERLGDLDRGMWIITYCT